MFPQSSVVQAPPQSCIQQNKTKQNKTKQTKQILLSVYPLCHSLYDIFDILKIISLVIKSPL